MTRPELRLDSLYRNTSNWKDNVDIFNKMFHQFSDGKGIQNSGVFRYKSKAKSNDLSITNAAFVILITTFGEIEWPDYLDEISGIFTYYGDKRTPGDLHDTHAGGNRLLRYVFENVHDGERLNVPPFLCFERVRQHNATHMRFLGLASPGANGVSSLEDLVAVWRRKDKRFQNYRSIFTIFNEPVISWEWLDDMVDGTKPHESMYCPEAWKKWVDTGRINALICASVPHPRSKKSQLPNTKNDQKILDRIKEISDREFEFAARDILTAIDRKFTDFIVTTRVRDGGRDLIGFYEIGHEPFLARLEVFVEAKKWSITRGIGVKPVSRLISRLRHRDLGVFITTTYFDKQVQQEIIDDGHPVILISGKDIVDILKKTDLAGPGYEKKLEEWLRSIAAIAAD